MIGCEDSSGFGHLRTGEVYELTEEITALIQAPEEPLRKAFQMNTILPAGTKFVVDKYVNPVLCRVFVWGVPHTLLMTEVAKCLKKIT